MTRSRAAKTKTPTTVTTRRRKAKTREQMRLDLLAAMDRLLAGKPKRSDGALDIDTLCAEADVVRGSAYRACREILDDFEAKVRDRAHDEIMRHPMVRAEHRATEAEKLVATLKQELVEARQQISTLANQLNMAVVRVKHAEDVLAAHVAAAEGAARTAAEQAARRTVPFPRPTVTK